MHMHFSNHTSINTTLPHLLSQPQVQVVHAVKNEPTRVPYIQPEYITVQPGAVVQPKKVYDFIHYCILF